jgi:hypothetical protein
MKKTPTILLFFLCTGILLSGCATILGSRSNTLIVESQTQDSVKVYLDGDFLGNGPAKFKLNSRKIQHGSELVIKSEDYPDETYRILRKPNAVYMIADAVLGAIPLAVDYGTAQIYRPSPRKFEYNSSTEPKD